MPRHDLGQHLLVKFPRVNELHGRVVCSVVGNEVYVIRTPDGDLYAEDYSERGGDVEKVLVRDGVGVVPPGARGARVYDFRGPLSAARLVPVFAEADVEAQAERRARGWPEPGAEPPAPEPEAGRRNLRGAPGLPLAGASRDPPLARGDSGVPIPGPAALGALGQVGGGAHRSAELSRGGFEKVNDEEVRNLGEDNANYLDDARTLAVAYDHSGQRHRDFRSAVPLLTQDAWADFPVRGPRTTLWVLRFMSEQGTTPRGWHKKWRTEMRLQLSDQGVSLHELACEFLEHLVCFDQTNAPNLAAAEAAARQLQLVEERWRERAIGSTDGLDHQDIAVFAGRATRGNLCICPSLQEWVAAELQKE